MTNPVLLVSGVGMMTVGILAILCWGKTRPVCATPLVFGGTLWVAAIDLKVAIDLVMGRVINAWANATRGRLERLYSSASSSA